RWATGTEINCRGFALERSIDGKTFAEINFIKGAGNSKITQQYSYQDADIFTATKTAYYRLKQVDFDGSYTYSEVVVVKQEGVQNEQISVYPNPVMDKLTIEIETLKGGAADVIITDITGKTISSLPINVIKGFNKYELNNTTNLTNGVYMITIVQNGQKVYNSKFVKAN
ncbi:MAG: T9SS type A sorting domain-containing protein, partial [Bacteroidia bacterium]|nr:T9SS type A sorting domain-containing protein [Bacteroidia bacterium]